MSRRPPGEGRDEGLSSGERAVLRVSAALASGDADLVDGALERAAADAAPALVEEALLQSYLFLGYPAALNALGRWREISGRGAPEPTDDDWDAWRARGRRVCATVYADQYEALRENVSRLHPDLERWMVAEGYGKVLGRPGMSLRLRELCIAALLAVLDAPVQLYSHLRGALNAGASASEVDEALEAASGYGDEGARERARATWARVRRRQG